MIASSFKKWIEDQPDFIINREKACKYLKELINGIYPPDDWMLVMLVICSRPNPVITRGYLLEKLELAQVRGSNILDVESRAEYRRLGGK